jgi:hypothetical protein
MIDETISLKTGEVAVVGYGSLLSRAIIGQTLGNDYDRPFVLCHINGWCRSWNVTMPNAAFYYIEDERRVYPARILYLNVRRDSNTVMNCSVFVVGPGERDAMDGREWIFDPTIVTSDLRGVSIEGGDAVMYVGKSDHASNLLRPVTKLRYVVRFCAVFSACWMQEARLSAMSGSELRTRFRNIFWLTTGLTPVDLILGR